MIQDNDSNGGCLFHASFVIQCERNKALIAAKFWLQQPPLSKWNILPLNVGRVFYNVINCRCHNGQPGIQTQVFDVLLQACM